MKTQVAALRIAVRRFGRHVGAVTAIEFGMLATPFFALLLAIFGTSLAFIGELTLDNAVAKVGRQIRTGEVAQSAMDEATFRKAVCEAAVSLFDCAQLKIDVRTYDNYASLPKGPPLTGPKGNQTLDTSGFGFTVGKADAIMAVQVYYEWPILMAPAQAFLSGMSSGSYLIGSVFAFRTEPYDKN